MTREDWKPIRITARGKIKMPMHIKEGDYYTLTEIAEKLGYISTSNFAKDCQEGRILAIKVGKTWLVPDFEVDRLSRKEQKSQGNRGVARK